ncbi:MAG: HD domain-containing protein [Coxiellaceae bacterium]|nr:MAG: HD domain-containing protein [Coxiellaceae bacterium]
MRHSWLSNGRQESVAEHSWRLALLAFRWADKLDQPVNLMTCLQMALVHDLAEAKVGDVPVFATQTKASKQQKYASELSAMQEITASLGDLQAETMYALWNEYETQQTYESKFIKAIDKIEAFMQHNEAPIETWESREKRMVFQSRWLYDYCVFDSFLTAVADAVIEKAIERLQLNQDDIAQIAAEAKAEEALFDREYK